MGFFWNRIVIIICIPGISPQSSYDLPENITPIGVSEIDAKLYKEPIIKLHRLTENVNTFLEIFV